MTEEITIKEAEREGSIVTPKQKVMLKTLARMGIRVIVMSLDEETFQFTTFTDLKTEIGVADNYQEALSDGLKEALKMA